MMILLAQTDIGRNGFRPKWFFGRNESESNETVIEQIATAFINMRMLCDASGDIGFAAKNCRKCFLEII